MKELLLINILVFISIMSGSAQNKADKPNILWITFEDTSPHMIYDNPAAKTPVMDKMAETGIRFNSAFSTATICSASRSAIITGLHATSIGTGNHRSKVNLPSQVKGFPYYLRKEGYYTTNNKKKDYNVMKTPAFTKEAWDESSGNAHWRNRPTKKTPFFSVFNIMYSHASRKFVNPEKKYIEEVYNNLPEEFRTTPEEVVLPEYIKDTPKMRKHFARIYNCINYTDYTIGKILDELKKDKLEDNTIVFIYSDHGEAMPRGKGNGLNTGHRVPLYVYVPKKYQGLTPFKSGKATDQVMSFEDLGPTVLSLAGVEIPSHMEGGNFLSSSFKKEMFYGAKDGTDDARDITREVSDGRFIYSRIYNPILPELQYKHYTGHSKIYVTMRDDLWKNRLKGFQKSIFTEERAYETLYDLKNDPWEMNNLADDPEFKEQLEKMRAFCQEQILATRDLQFMPSGEMLRLDKESGLTPFEYKTDEEIYPLSKILPIAELSGKGKEVIEQQVEALNDNEDLVRYWALFGLKNQKEDAEPYLDKIIKMMENDKAAFNRIEAATIVHALKRDDASKAVLNKYALSTDMFYQWYALRNIQDYLPNQLDFVDTYNTALSKLKPNKSLPEDLKNVRFDVFDTCKGALYMIKQKQKYNLLPAQAN
ncbi:sulfatase family protein [Flammeovirga agarivorans]|uniref:Sulfatase-like hydrolase/transferase n=1 Tax=Flammeovirga agarivorans TaxID=2726742 RepID=A0A7X8SNH0_9BACT|nr:sulfatase-like hydrolase/transferase [Flammeovirga agarivorans]NLR93449.1 sulfatase-like hydrolase/transferase [Flammeovirga agarivorans]